MKHDRQAHCGIITWLQEVQNIGMNPAVPGDTEIVVKDWDGRYSLEYFPHLTIFFAPLIIKTWFSQHRTRWK
jgi:hypothetical protein